ncbi:MAG: DinB family protein [bacterium]|nr:DinB family protein [bacterium]
MKKSISTKRTPANIALVLAQLRETPQQLEQFGLSLSEQQRRQPLGEGERSITQDVAHLLHCEARTSEGIYLALLVDEPLLPDLHPERDWGRLLRYDLLDWPDLLAYFRLRRAVLLRVLEALTEAQWSRVVREEAKQRKESVYWQARTLALHELDHLTDLQKKLGGNPAL